MNEKQYIIETYSKFWENQTKNYGYTLYEQNLVRLIAKSNPKKVFEVGIGTGWPIGAALKKKGIAVDGCDLAESSVVLAQEELGNKTGIWTGDVLEYSGYNLYDVVYCVRASWYIPDFYATLAKMMSMTKNGGYIVFDVMNRNSLYCLQIRKRLLKERYLKFLGIDMEEVYGVHFADIHKMKRFLKKNSLSYQVQGERAVTGNKDRFRTPKVVFVCRKGY